MIKKVIKFLFETPVQYGECCCCHSHTRVITLRFCGRNKFCTKCANKIMS